MGFEIKLGGQLPKQEDKNVDNLKWDTCKHRSAEKELCHRICCGGRRTPFQGFRCHLLNIEDLNAKICAGCPKYEQKEEEIK